MIDEAGVVGILTAAYVLEVALALWAYAGILRYWREEGGRENRVWTALVVMKGLAVGTAVVMVPIAVAALFDLPRLPLTGPIVVLAFMVQLAAVIVYRLVFDSIRRRGYRVASGEAKEPDNDESAHG